MKEVIDFKIGDEYKEGDILKMREDVYLLVEKATIKEFLKCCNSCWFYNAPWDTCVQMDCTANNLHFRPFEHTKRVRNTTQVIYLKYRKRKSRENSYLR